MTWAYGVQDGLPVLALSGNLTTAASTLLHRLLGEARQQGQAAVLIDVSALAVNDTETIALFASIMIEALQWPDVSVLICAPTTEMRNLLGAGAVDPRLLFDSVAAGRAAAMVAVPSITEDLLPIAGAARRARDVVTEACLRWDEPSLVGNAALVISELVTNASMHANTMMTLQIRLRSCHLHIAVFDGSATHAVARQAGSAGVGGRGLQLVDAVSAAWGSTALATGKVVWSALDRPGSP
ncbi:STAS domain-containing protein [Nucisporomicrobium flavum]|uniref:STAS domain-containing protein n=1 Tax=Nucisporomicrobium flavum TaxID=2785915 RepID=UPI0018F4F72E|nr:STAS domain-containing protein [Nucisporomicrobium flavum]